VVEILVYEGVHAPMLGDHRHQFLMSHRCLQTDGYPFAAAAACWTMRVASLDQKDMINRTRRELKRLMVGLLLRVEAGSLVLVGAEEVATEPPMLLDGLASMRVLLVNLLPV
jgi:hypothetical protein